MSELRMIQYSSLEEAPFSCSPNVLYTWYTSYPDILAGIYMYHDGFYCTYIEKNHHFGQKRKKAGRAGVDQQQEIKKLKF